MDSALLRGGPEDSVLTHLDLFQSTKSCLEKVFGTSGWKMTVLLRRSEPRKDFGEELEVGCVCWRRTECAFLVLRMQYCVRKVD